MFLSSMPSRNCSWFRTVLATWRNPSLNVANGGGGGSLWPKKLKTARSRDPLLSSITEKQIGSSSRSSSSSSSSCSSSSSSSSSGGGQ